VPNNLPEIRKRQYENKGSVRASRRNRSIAGRYENKNVRRRFSAERNTTRDLTRCNIGKRLEWRGFASQCTDRRLHQRNLSAGTCRAPEQSSHRASRLLHF
jgi:hypothetical protein